MDGVLVVVQFAHIAGGAAWLGGSLFANLVVLPYIARQPAERQRGLVAGIVLGPEQIMIAAALLAGLTGLARGIVFGPITSLTALGSPYGLVWLGAIVAAAAVFAIGGGLTSPAARKLRDDDSIWRIEDPSAATERMAVMARVRIGFRVELAGIVLILALMAVLPFAGR